MQTSSYTQKPLHVNHVETLLWQETYDDSKYPKPSVTADIVIFGMFDKEEDNYRKIAEKELLHN